MSLTLICFESIVYLLSIIIFGFSYIDLIAKHTKSLDKQIDDACSHQHYDDDAGHQKEELLLALLLVDDGLVQFVVGMDKIFLS
jgi:hypothetical protein